MKMKNMRAQVYTAAFSATAFAGAIVAMGAPRKWW